MKKIGLFLVLFSVFICHAQTGFKVQASKTTVEVGETFQLIYTINYKSAFSNLSAEEIVFPSFNFFNELGTSQSSSVSIINNKTTAEITYIKTLQATKKGVFTFGSAKIVGKKIKSNSIKITVIPSQNSPTPPQIGTKNEKNLPQTFVKWIIEKNNPYVYEGINLKLRIYSKQVETFQSIEELKPPKFEGLTTHIIKSEQVQPKIEIEEVNGEEYAFLDLQQWIVFPQTSETITIGSAEVGISQFSSFFNNGLSYLNSDIVEIKAKPLPPNAPKNFGGAVGQFIIKSSVNKFTLKNGESTDYDIEIIGKGNLDLMKIPDISLSDSIEIYTPKERQNFSATQKGLKGKIAATYVLVPQFEGEFVLPSVSFSYFDPIEEVYKTMESEKIILAVSGSISKINPIQDKKSDTESSVWQKLKPNVTLIGFLLIGIIILFYVIVKRWKNNPSTIEIIETKPIEALVSNTSFDVKKELDFLKKLVDENKPKLYYEKQDTFINEWLLEKTGLPQSKLTIQSAKEHFLHQGFSTETVDELENVINNSKEAKYASIFHNNTINLNETYRRLTDSINKF